MAVSPQIPDVVREVRRRLEALYGPRLCDVILYGSYARGEADEGSDIDLLVVLEDFEDPRAELQRMEPIASDLSLEHEVLIAVLVTRQREYAERNSPLLLNIRREGVAV